MQAPSFLALFFTIVLAAGIASCKGPEGPQGPAGAQGVAGAPGTQGPKGDQGNANVVTSGWFKPQWNAYDWTIPPSNSRWINYQVYNSGNSLFTEEAINTASIHTYIKYQALVGATQGYELTENITANPYATSYIKIPGRTTNAYNDFLPGNYSSRWGKNLYIPWFEIDVRVYNEDKLLWEISPDMSGKSTEFYLDLVKDYPQIRHVIVYGNPAGRTADINWDNYEEVKEALGLED